jgi:hypothetical protein
MITVNKRVVRGVVNNGVPGRAMEKNGEKEEGKTADDEIGKKLSFSDEDVIFGNAHDILERSANTKGSSHKTVSEE